MLVATKVGKSYGRRNVLDRIDLQVAPQCFTALLGPSGSGKTTLLKCLSGNITPTTGKVEFDGLALHELTDASLSRLRLNSFGFVFQHNELLPELTATENVLLPWLLSGRKRGPGLARAKQLLEFFGLEKCFSQRPAQLSGGERQRTAIARALICDPQVVFADEPTGALDSANSELVMNTLASLARTHAVTVVMVTHNAESARYADRQIHLLDGRIVADTLAPEANRA